MKNGLNKKDSTLIYGIAILMMIYHHLFSNPQRLGDTSYFSILNTMFGGITEQRLAWLFRLCVPFYAFISGYGICTIISKKDYTERCSLSSIGNNYLLALKQILKLMKKYWLVLAIFLPIGLLFFNFSLIGPRTFTRCILGLGNDYNAEWWYIKQYMMMVLLFPIFDFILCNLLSFINNYVIAKFKYGKVIILGVIFLCGVFFLLFRNAPVFSYLISQLDNGNFVFTLVFFVGFLCAFFHLFEIGSKNLTFQKLKLFLAFALLFVCVGIRWIRAYDAVYCKYDAFITAPIIYSVVTLCNYLKPLAVFLQNIGRYSTYMWLTHTFFCFYYMSHWILATRLSFFMFLATTVLSLFTSWILTFWEKKISLFFTSKSCII